MSFASNASLSASDVGAIADVVGARNNGSGFGFGDGNSAWWIIILMLFLNGNNGWGNNGGAMPYYMMSNSTNNDVQRGFDQAAVTSGINSLGTAVNNGFASVNQGLCNSTAAITSTVNNGFANAEIASGARQTANMQQLFGLQTGLGNQLNTIAMNQQNCCCENRAAIADVKYAIATENCADRAALSEGLQNLLMNNQQQYNALITTINNGFQAVYNQNCMDKIDAKNEKIADLERQLSESRTLSAITGLGNRVEDSNNRQTVALEQYLNPTAIPAYIVQNPNCCNTGYSACPCGAR